MTSTPPTTQATPTPEHEVRDIPVWLTAVVLLLCIAGGGWLIRWQLKKETPGQLVTLPDDKLPASVKNWKAPPAAARPNRPNSAKTGDGVHALSNKSWKINAGPSVMHVNLGKKDEILTSFNYVQPLRTAEQAELAMIRMSIVSDPTWESTLKVTKEQKERLKQVPVSLGMKVPDADKAKLTDLFKKWQTATPGDKANAEKALLTALQETGKACEAPTRQYEEERAQMVRTTLTGAQLKTYRDGGTAQPTP